jgi:flagellin-like protein
MNCWLLNRKGAYSAVKVRRAVSPFIATVILVAITLTLGGLLYTQFRQVVTAEVRNPSISLTDVNVASDRQSVTLVLKNDGNVQLNVSKIVLLYQSTTQRFVPGTNMTILAGSSSLVPGDLMSLQFTLKGITIPEFSSFTVTVVSDQLARAFTVQA